MKETASQRKKDKVLRTSMYVAVLIGLAGFLIFSILAAITFGNADLSLKDVYSVIAYKLFHIKSLSATQHHELRLPHRRTCLPDHAQ